MLDAVLGSLDSGNVDQARDLLASVVDRQRDAIRSLRDLSFALEPIILRDQGFVPAVRALAEQLGVSRSCASTSTSTPAKTGRARAGDALPDHPRRAPPGAPPRAADPDLGAMAPLGDGGVETVITDDGAAERRRRVFEPLEERARAVNGTVEVDRRTSTAPSSGSPSRPTRPGNIAPAMAETGHVLFVQKTTGYELQDAEGDVPRRAAHRARRRDGVRRLEGRPVAAPGRLPALRVPSARLASADVLCSGEAEHERLREPARVAAGRDAAGVHACGVEPVERRPVLASTRACSSTRRPPIVCVMAAWT